MSSLEEKSQDKSRPSYEFKMSPISNMEKMLNVQREEIRKLKAEQENDQQMIRLLNTLKSDQEKVSALSDEVYRKNCEKIIEQSSEISKQKAEIDFVKEKLFEAESLRNDRDENISELKKKVNSLKVENDSLKSKMKDLKQNFGHLKHKSFDNDEMENLSNQLCVEVKKNKEFSSKIVRLANYIKVLKQRLESMPKTQEADTSSVPSETPAQTDSATQTDPDAELPIQTEQVKNVSFISSMFSL